MAFSEISPKHFIPDYNDFTNDKRLDIRWKQLSESLCMRPGSNISQLSESRADQVAYYRLLENDRLTEKALMDGPMGRMGNLCTGCDLLSIQDTFEVNLSKNKNRVKFNAGLGESDNSWNATCFKIHPGFVLNEDDFNPLGFSGVKVFHREEEGPRLP